MIALGAYSEPVKFFFDRFPDDPIECIRTDVERYKPSLIVLDTLFRAFPSMKDGNDYNETKRSMDMLLDLARDNQVAIVGIHHARKSGGRHGQEGTRLAEHIRKR